MDIQIREGKAEDAYAISELNKNELGYEFEAEKTKEKLSHILNGNRSKLFVAVVQNAVVGYIHAADYDVVYAPHMKDIMGIAVSSKFRRNGIGKSVIMRPLKIGQKIPAHAAFVSSQEKHGQRHTPSTAIADIIAIKHSLILTKYFNEKSVKFL